ncbi:MAG: transcription factor S [Promethearchaeota archaeon]
MIGGNVVEFCPECEGMLMTRRKGARKVLVCRCCGFEREVTGNEDREAYVHSEKIEHHPRERLEAKLMNEEYYDRLVPYSAVDNFRCPRCGFDRAYLQSRQTRSADEGMTHFIICGKCGKMIKIGS